MKTNLKPGVSSFIVLATNTALADAFLVGREEPVGPPAFGREA